MLLLPAFALLVVGAGAFAATLRLPLAGTLVAAYVLAFAEVILVAEALSPFHAIGEAGFLALETLIAAAGTGLWLRAGRPSPTLPRFRRGLISEHPLLVVLGIAVVVAVCFEAFLAVSVPPNNWDGMTYHLSRAAAWLQHGSLGRITAHTQRENAFPPNAEIQVLFTFVFAHGDRFAALPQFFAQLALIAGIFGTARRLGFDRPASVFAALMFTTLSEVALQATTVQNDLVVSACVVAAVYFVLGRTRVNVILGAIALGLGVGTKLTALYALPVIAVVALATLPRRRLAELAVASGLAVTALGGYVYIANATHDGSVLGPASVRAPFEPKVTSRGTVSTFGRILYRFGDLSGYSPDWRVETKLRGIGSAVFQALHLDANPPESSQTRFSFQPNTYANEDQSYFGPLGLLLLLPLAVVAVALRVVRRGSAVEVALALAIPLFALEVALTYRYNLWIGRFMVVPVALASAVVARVYATRLISATFACVGIVFLSFALQHNERKPIGRTGTPAWSLSRVAVESLTASGYDMPLETVAALVPDDATIGYRFGEDDFDYPLYGPRLTRRLVALPEHRTLKAAAARGIEWVVTSAPTPRSAEWTGVVFPSSRWRLFVRADGADARRLISYVHRLRTPPDYRLVAPYLVGARVAGAA
jgi:hypothetical protein